MTRVTHASVEAKINQIEAEMRNVGIWQEEPLPPERLDVRAAFGQDKMSFEQWLQFIFLPRVREIIATKGDWPPSSQVSVQAFREWKQWGSEEKYDHLLELLREFDALFARTLPTGMPQPEERAGAGETTKHKGAGCVSMILVLILAVAIAAYAVRKKVESRCGAVEWVSTPLVTEHSPGN